MADQQSNLITSFVLSSLRKDYLEALRILANLKFPLPDLESFVRQVESESDKPKGPGKAATARLLDTLGSLDFPIQSPRGAMEKFHAKNIAMFGLDIPPQLSVFDQRPFRKVVKRPEINVRTEYIQSFGLECGLEAYDAYLATSREGRDPDVAEVLAYLAGRREGERCVRSHR